jgi:methyl-accepting chemotaxis protein
MKLTLGKKLGLGFGVILTLMVFGSMMSYLKSGSIKASQDITFEVRYPSLEICKDLQRDLNQTQSKGRQAVLAGAEPARRDAAMKLFNGTWDDIGKDLAALDELAPKWTLQENRDRLSAMKPHLAELRAAQEAAMNRAASGEKDAVINGGNEFADKATPANEAIKVSLGGMATSFIELVAQNKEDLHAENRSLTVTMAITTFLALGIGIFVALYLSRRISGATHAVLVQAEAIADGDLTHDDLRVQSQDELGDLTTAINKMRGSLTRMILAITQNAMQVASASEELSSTSQQISANSQETSAQAGVVSTAAQTVSQNLQTVATGAEEMGASIKEIA